MSLVLKYPLLLSDFMEFGKIVKHKFHENPSSRSRVVPCGLTVGLTEGRTDGRTDGRTERHDETNSRF
jgi:hypothetical protein